MNNTFNAIRFSQLCKKTILERPVQIFGFTGLLLALSLILYVISKQLAGFSLAQNLTFIWGLAGGGCFLGSFVFGYFSSNASGSSYLTLPASHFEKWLCGVIITGIFYPAVFMLFYRLIDLYFVWSYHNSLDPASPFYKQQYERVYLFSFTGRIAPKAYPLFLFVTSAMYTGSLYFNKAAFIKTAIVVCALCIGIFGLNWFIAQIFFGTITDAGLFDHVSVLAGKEEGFIELPGKASSFFQYSLDYVIPLLLWAVAYIRLREKEF